LEENTKFKEERSFRIPLLYNLEKVITFLYHDLDLKKYMLTTERDRNDATCHIELLLKSKILAPEDGQP
jgi:hypothetical protein